MFVLKSKINIMRSFTNAASLAVLLAPAIAGAQDLEIQTLNSNWGFNYDAGTGIVSNLFFKPAEGDGVDITDDFVIAVFIENQETNQSTELARQTVQGGIPAYNAITADNWGDINLNDHGLPAGSYLIYGSVDTDDDISESDENDNTLYLATSANDAFDFTPGGGGTSGVDDQVTPELHSIYPNPIGDHGIVTIRMENSAQVSGEFTLRITDLLGREVYTRSDLHQSNLELEIDLSFLPEGTYVYRLAFGDNTAVSGRLVR